MVTVSLSTESDEGTRAWWPHDFHLVHRATIGAELTQELVMTNTGAAPVRFEEALHTYYRVGAAESGSHPRARWSDVSRQHGCQPGEAARGRHCFHRADRSRLHGHDACGRNPRPRCFAGGSGWRRKTRAPRWCGILGVRARNRWRIWETRSGGRWPVLRPATCAPIAVDLAPGAAAHHEDGNPGCAAPGDSV